MITPKVKSLKSYKTPLRYPGGKSRALSKIFQFAPDLTKVKQYREPFLGGGSVALEMSKRYPLMDIWVNDLYEPLYNFWCVLQHDVDELYETLFDLKSVYCNQDAARCLFDAMKEAINNKDITDVERAVAFYVVNKCSFSGLTESSSFSAQASDSNFSMNGINKLIEYSHMIESWTITNLSYEELLTDDKDVFLYLDPPYDIKDNLYGKSGDMHKRFDHDDFAKQCDHHTSPMLISYNSDQIVKDRFKEWSVSEFAHTYTMRSVGCYNTEQASRKELVLLNYDLPSDFI
jgi:DNA adenine methylase